MLLIYIHTYYLFNLTKDICINTHPLRCRHTHALIRSILFVINLPRFKVRHRIANHTLAVRCSCIQSCGDKHIQAPSHGIDLGSCICRIHQLFQSWHLLPPPMPMTCRTVLSITGRKVYVSTTIKQYNAKILHLYLAAQD